jgi:hypothetical protein
MSYTALLAVKLVQTFSADEREGIRSIIKTRIKRGGRLMGISGITGSEDFTSIDTIYILVEKYKIKEKRVSFRKLSFFPSFWAGAGACPNRGNLFFIIFFSS